MKFSLFSLYGIVGELVIGDPPPFSSLWGGGVKRKNKAYRHRQSTLPCTKSHQVDFALIHIKADTLFILMNKIDLLVDIKLFELRNETVTWK